MQGLLTKGKVQNTKAFSGLRRPARINEDIIDLTFCDFDTCKDPVLEVALEAAKIFCRDMASSDRPARWITLLGPSGVGKTMLMKCITRFFRTHLDYLLDERSEHMENHLRRGGFKPWLTALGEMQGGDFTGLMHLKSDWFLALDDIGTERAGNDFGLTKLYEVLYARENLFTVITCNLPLDSIAERMDTRISSRLLRNNSMLVDVETVDYSKRELDHRKR